MYRTHRFFLAMIIASAAVGCGKGKGKDPNADSTATTAAPAPPPATGKPEKHEKAEKPEKGEKPAGDKPAGDKPEATPTGGDAGFHWEVHKPTNIKFELPLTWTTSINGNVLVAKTPTPGVGLEFVGTEGKLSAKADEKALLKEVSKSLQKAKLVGKPKPVEQHGLKGHVSSGIGFKDGAEVEWLCAVLGDGHGKDMLTLGFYSPNLGATYKTQMQKVLDSIGVNK